MFHPVHTFINKTVRDFTARPVLRRYLYRRLKKSIRTTRAKRKQRIYKRKSRFTMGRVQTRLELAKISGRSIY